MNTKILLSLLTVGVASSALGYGTFAFFSDTETSDDNLFAAGTLDLVVDGLGDTTVMFSALSGDNTNIAPGDHLFGNLTLTNIGTIYDGDLEGHAVVLDLKALVTEVEGGSDLNGDPDLGGVNPAGDDLMDNLRVVEFTYDGGDLTGGVPMTLADLDGFVVTDLADPLNSGGKVLYLHVEFVEDGASQNHLMNDEVTIDFEFYLRQPAAPALS